MPETTSVYTLYGSYASYYTAKVRSYLRKKGIGFVERLPSDPAFREIVRPASGSHRIPQLMTPDGEVLQDSVTIIDFLEPRFPTLPAFPDTPRQRTFVHLFELLGSEGLLRLAWLHRWMFEENDHFVRMDFGRSFRPQGDDEALLKYGSLIADRMRSYGLPESTVEARAALEEAYVALLAHFEAHLTEHPYLLGGHPSAADYAVMGAMHAHLGRDPAGLRTMQTHAPRTFRWVEHMLLPEVVAPEFAHHTVTFVEDDQVPDTALAILRFIAARYGDALLLNVLAFDQAVHRMQPKAGQCIDAERDQPLMPAERVVYTGREQDHAASVYGVWLAQRAQKYYRQQSSQDQTAIEEMLGEGVARELLRAPLTRTVQRRENRFFFD